MKDFETAMEGIVIDSQDVDELTESIATPSEQAEIIHKTAAFKNQLSRMIVRESSQSPWLLKRSKDESKDSTGNADGNRGAGINVTDSVSSNESLTLFGGAAGGATHPKQLWASLRDPASGDKSTSLSELLRAHGLPNGISTTRIIPVHSGETEDKKGIPTFGDLFSAPGAATLNPPKQSRHTSTRGSSVNWVRAPESVSSKSQRRESYPAQGLATGQWLVYNAPPSASQLSSPEAKRRQRDRALSFGEVQSIPPQEDATVHRQAKEDALFRSVFSSFAPDRDNTNAIVPEHMRNRLWWSRKGCAKFTSMTSGYPDPLEDREKSIEVDDVAEDNDFKEVVESWTPDPLPVEFKETGRVLPKEPENMEEIDEILQSISELLETLYSYQRIRNMSLTSNARNIAGTNSQTATASADSPSAAEFDIYEVLKSQLQMMIATLPSHAVARLNGEKLGALNVSMYMPVEVPSYKGVLEDEESKAAALQPVMNSYPRAPTTASAGYRNSTYTPPATTPLNQRAGYVNPSTAPRPIVNPSAYLPNQQYSSRPPSANYQFSGSARSTYLPQGSSQRPAYNTPNQYQHVPQNYGTYPSNYRQYAPQNMSAYNQNLTAQMTPTTQPRPMPTQYPSNLGRSASPPRPAVYTPQPPPPPQYSPQMSMSGRNTPQNVQTPGQMYHQHSSSYTPKMSQSPQPNGVSVSPSDNQRPHLTAEEQTSLMARQKAQLAERQNSEPLRQGSGTPQPMSVNSNHAGNQPNGISYQSNGIRAGDGI